VEINVEQGSITNERTGKNIPSTKLPGFILEIISDGGLIKHLRKRLGISTT